MDIFVGPDSCQRLHKVFYPQVKHPKELQSYLHDEENLTLYEVIKFNDKYRSWFIDNLLCKEGHFNFLTKLDPLFIFLPQIIRFAREQFRTLHDICQTFSSDLDNAQFSDLNFALTPDIDWSKICDTQQIDDELFIRYNETKTLDWLMMKHKKTVAALADELGPEASRATLISYAFDLIDQYIPDSLTTKFKTISRSESLVEPIVVNNTKSAAKTTTGKQQKRSAPTTIATTPSNRNTSGQSISSRTSGGIMNFFKPLRRGN